VASNYTKFEWYYSGLPSAVEAEKLLNDSLAAFNSMHEQNDWVVNSSVKQNSSGWACGFTAVKDVQSG